MSFNYTSKTNWQRDDIVTESDLNRIEQGIKDIYNTNYVLQTSQSKAFSPPSMAKTGYLKRWRMKGQTLFNSVENSGFQNGISTWDASVASLTLENSILKVAVNENDNSTFVSTSTNTIGISGNRIFKKVKLRVTNADCSELKVTLTNYNPSNDQSFVITNPVVNKWYTVSCIDTLPNGFDGEIAIKISHHYANDTIANGKVMEIDGQEGIWVINLTSLGIEKKVEDEIAEMLPSFYRDGLVETEALTIYSVGHNLFDGKAVQGYIDNTGNLQSGEFYKSTEKYIQIKPSVNYNIKHFNANKGIFFNWYDLNKNYIGKNEFSNTQNCNQTSPQNAHYLKVTLGNETDGIPEPVFVVINEGDAPPLEYISYQSSSPISISNVGYSLPDGVCDEVYSINGKIYHKQNIALSNELTISSQYGDNEEFAKTYCFITTDTFSDGLVGDCSNSIGICSDGLFNGYCYPEVDARGIYLGAENMRFYVHVEKNKINAMTGSTILDKGIAYFNLNPLRVLYQLETSHITELDVNPDLLITEDGQINIENTGAIGEFKAEYCVNVAAVSKQNIEVIDHNRSDIETNRAKIADNNSNIRNNTTAINTANTNISRNAEKIAKNAMDLGRFKFRVTQSNPPIVEYKRQDNTLYLRKTASNPDSKGFYRTIAEQYYDTSGNLLKTITFTLTFDASGLIRTNNGGVES